MKKKQWVFVVMFLSYTFIYVARLNLSMAGPGLISNGVLDATQIGMLGSAFSTVYALGRLLNGGISDTTPPWKMLSMGLAVAGISNLCIGLFPPFIGIFVLWMSNAYAQSMLWSSILRVVTKLFGKTAKRKMSVMVSSVAVGNILGIVINTWLITRLGISYAFFLPGAVTILLCIATMLATKPIVFEEEIKKEHTPFLSLLKRKELLEMTFPAAFHGIMKENISLWMTVFIVDRYAVDLNTSSYYVLLIPVIGLIGRLLYPIVFRLLRENENYVSCVGFGICIIAAVLLWWGRIGILVSALALGLIYTAVSMINTSFLSIYPLRYAQTGNEAAVSGIMDFATYLGAGISGAVYGVVIKHFGYTPMFASWAVVSVISLVVIIKINKKEGKNI